MNNKISNDICNNNAVMNGKRHEVSENAVAYFAAGPSKLPHEVLLDVQSELIEYKSTRISPMELSHRSADFQEINSNAEKLIRDILDVPQNYKIIFMQGGGTGQFSCVPMNLMSKTGKADYVVTGSWSQKAAKEAEKYGEVNLVLKSSESYTEIAPQEQWKRSSDASYLYYCANETVEGVEFDYVPDTLPGVPLVCDMSSNICTRKIEVSKFGVIFAGAQKNIGCAGVTMVIVREDLLGSAFPYCPSVFDYAKMAKQNSILNTPSTFSVYVLMKVLTWVSENGGIEAMTKKSIEKSSILYDQIDSSNGFYHNYVNPKDRSRMNVTFRVGGQDGNESLEKAFVKEASDIGLLSLKGHRSVGGIRASIYNAVSLEDVQKLRNFMEIFMKNNKNLMK